MKTNLFFFSSTGNSLKIAKEIAVKLPDTQICSIPDVINRELDLKADNIGLVFPVYFGGMPRIVTDFINQLNLTGTHYIFAVCTFGGFAGGTLYQLQQQLKSKGLALNAGFSIRMPGNYLAKYGAFPVKIQKYIFNKAKKKVDTVVQTVVNRENRQSIRYNLFINGISNLFYKSMLPKFPKLDQNFYVTEKCTACHTCEKVCPVQNIKMADGKPVWQGNCEHCMACIQWCPQEAIQYGRQTINRKRYHCPEVSVKELYHEP